jgi:phosphoribosylpyrophosphate synthetase
MMTIDKEKNNTSDTSSKKYNLMFVATPDTADRVKHIQTNLTTILSEEVEMQVLPFNKFANTAWNVMLTESVRGKHVYIYADVESNYQSQELLADTNSRYMFIR